MIVKICTILFCLMGLAVPMLILIDYKRAEKGKKAVFFEDVDNKEEE